jgi:hypothetical protein
VFGRSTTTIVVYSSGQYIQVLCTTVKIIFPRYFPKSLNMYKLVEESIFLLCVIILFCWWKFGGSMVRFPFEVYITDLFSVYVFTGHFVSPLLVVDIYHFVALEIDVDDVRSRQLYHRPNVFEIGPIFQ